MLCLSAAQILLYVYVYMYKRFYASRFFVLCDDDDDNTIKKKKKIIQKVVGCVFLSFGLSSPLARSQASKTFCCLVIPIQTEIIMKILQTNDLTIVIVCRSFGSAGGLGWRQR